MTENFLSGKVDLIFPHLRWGSFASNWLLFESQRVSAPRPWLSGTMVLANLKFSFAKEHMEVMAHAPYAREWQMYSRPLLVMSEVTLKDHTLFSAWVFLDSESPSVDSLRVRYNVQKVRGMQFSEDNLARMLFVHEISPELVSFACVREVDARTNTIWYGTIHRYSRICTILFSTFDIRNCPECTDADRVCKCQGDSITRSFENEFRRRKNMDEVSMNISQFGNNYLSSWNGGTWTSNMDALPDKPVLFRVKYIFEGQHFESSLTSVIQNEVLSIQPPRATARLIAMLAEQASSEEAADWPVHEDAELGNTGQPMYLKKIKREWLNESSENFSRMSLSSSDGKESRSADPIVERKERNLNSRESKVHSCTKCEMKFRRRYDLTRHERTVHEKRRDFKCPQCLKEFSQQGHVNEHVRLVHQGSRKYPCDLCEMSFGLKSTRDKHIRNIHVNLRNYGCDVCGKRYKDKSSLTKHLSVHNASPGKSQEQK